MPHDSNGVAALPAWQLELNALKAESDQWKSHMESLERRNGGHVVAMSTGGNWIRDFYGKSYHCQTLPKQAGDIVKESFLIYGFLDKYESIVCARLLRAVKSSEVRAIWKLCRQTPRPPMATGQWWEVIAD